MQCDDPCHHCFMCDDDAKEGQEGKCVVCYKKAELRKTTCELCIDQKKDIVQWDTSFKRDLDGVGQNDKDSPFRRVICCECGKGDGRWTVPVERCGPREVLESHQG